MQSYEEVYLELAQVAGEKILKLICGQQKYRPPCPAEKCSKLQMLPKEDRVQAAQSQPGPRRK